MSCLNTISEWHKGMQVWYCGSTAPPSQVCMCMCSSWYMHACMFAVVVDIFTIHLQWTFDWFTGASTVPVSTNSTPKPDSV